MKVVVVVDANRKMTGILSLDDLAARADERLSGKALKTYAHAEANT